MIVLDTLREALQPPLTRISDPDRRASVSAVLSGRTTDLEGLDLLFMKRAEIAGDPWSGHIAFPGGHQEPHEGPLEAACRETREEVGLDLSLDWLLGELDEVGTPSGLPQLVVRPHVFHVHELPPLRPEPGEVDRVFTVPLGFLLANEGRGTMERTFRGTVWTLPRVELEHGILWGMTLRIVDDLLHRIDGRGTGLERQ